MGFYIEVAANSGKADLIVQEYGAERWHEGNRLQEKTPLAWANIPTDKFLVCVVNNGFFEAAGIAYDEAEFDAFNEPGDERPKQWLLIDRDRAFEAVAGLAKFMGERGGAND